jgi:hypothetical protein
MITISCVVYRLGGFKHDVSATVFVIRCNGGKGPTQFSRLKAASIYHCTSRQVKVKVTLRLTASQSVSLGVEPHLGHMTRYLLLCGSYGLVLVERTLWREDGSVFCVCCWPLPEQSFSGPRPYFTVSDLRLPFSSPPTTRRVTVEVFDPASTRVSPRQRAK